MTVELDAALLCFFSSWARKRIKTPPNQKQLQKNNAWLQLIFNYPLPEAVVQCGIGYVISATASQTALMLHLLHAVYFVNTSS